jgi:hypothetical protein
MIHLHVLTLLAHPGHPGPETHGSLTHLLVGLAIALPFALGGAFWLKRRKQASIAVKKPSSKN